MRTRLTLIALMLTLSVSAFAQVVAVPQLMNFQGRLSRPDGTPVPNGNYSIRFSLWTAAIGGTEKWNQTINPVSVRNGTFSVRLNTSTGAADKFNNNLWLEIKIGTNAPLTPRQQLVSVAYAMKADSVKDNAITSASIANGTITSADLASNALNSLSWLLAGNASPSASSFLGTTTNHPLNLRVNNRRAMQYTYVQDISDTDPDFHFRSINVLGGSDINSITAGVIGGTIVGGGQDYFTGTDNPNTVTANYGTVVGGSLNQANGFSFVGGGYNNKATEFYSTVVGGTFNTASNNQTFIGGGIANIASGWGSTIPGGSHNIAAGDFSLAAGNYAQALHPGSFVWADNSQIATPIVTTGSNQFLIRATGGVNLGPGTFLDLGFGVPWREGNAGRIGYQLFTPNALDIVGAGTDGGNRQVKIWAEGGTHFSGEINTYSNINAAGHLLATTLYIRDLPYGDRRNVQWDSNSAQFYYDNSSRRHKENITPLKDDFFKLLDAQPMTYTRPTSPDIWEIGFIAEDFDALGLKKLVDYEKDGKTPAGINYEKICLYLTAIARQQEDRFKSQESRLKTLEAENKEVKALKEEIAELKALMQQKAGQK
jgi:hypothetical protein